jgi:hypothetical protein
MTVQRASQNRQANLTVLQIESVLPRIDDAERSRPSINVTLENHPSPVDMFVAVPGPPDGSARHIAEDSG